MTLTEIVNQKNIIVFSITFVLGFILFFQIFRPTIITVKGEGKSTGVPSKLSIIVGRINFSHDSGKAMDEGNAGMRVLIDTAKEISGEETEISRYYNQITPQQGQQSVDGRIIPVTSFQAVNAFSLTTSNVNKTQTLIRELYKNGATSVSNVSFVVDDQDEKEQVARKKAINEAKIEAKKIASAAGKRVGRVVSITEETIDSSGVIGRESNTNDPSSGFTEIDIVRRVSVVFEIW